jgi:N-acetylmuramoyl-L-alanine amidase
MKIIIRLLPLACFLLCGDLSAIDVMVDCTSKPSFACEVPVSVSTMTDMSMTGVQKGAMPIVPYIHIAHPCENAHLPELASTFVYGMATTSGTLTINNHLVPVDPGGGFLTMVDLVPGTCKIHAELIMATSVYAVTRTVTVEGPDGPSPVSPLTIEYVRPNNDYMVVPGDEISVTAKGSPGMKAYFTVDGIDKHFPLVETLAGQGLYTGVYVVSPSVKLQKAKIRVTLANTKKNIKKTKIAEGAISLLSATTPLVAETTVDDAILHAGPELSKCDTAGYYLFLPKGILLRISGSKGDELRVQLTKTKEAWISRSSVAMLPAGTPPGHAIAEDIVITGGERSTTIRIPLGRHIPFEVQPDIDGKYIDLLVYGAYSNTDFMTYVSTGIVEQVQWFQDDAQTYRVRAYTPSIKWWGYDVRYEGGNLVLEVRNPPPVVAGSTLPLAGLTIAVDAGHSPDTGAIGVTGMLERDVNIDIAKILDKKLTGLGATVVMTRKDVEPVALYDRPKIAWQSHADIFVSVHNNALSDGENPFKKNGYEIYYYHPASFDLAREIHTAYGEVMGINSAAPYKLHDGGIHYGNFVITRTFQMPTVLTESAYMIVPREESLLKTEQFKTACAEAISRGIVRYMNHMRPVKKPAEKKK